MKQTTKNILGIGAIVLLSSGVAGLTTYKLLQSNKAATETSFNEMFKQKTAYEMQHCDWSSDVCSSDLAKKNDCSYSQNVLCCLFHDL